MEIVTNATVKAAACGPIYTTLVLESRDLAALAQPGQFLHIRCEGFQLRRPISIAGVQGDTLTIIFETKGKGTQWLSQRQAGDLLDVLGPLGHGFPSVSGKLLLVGGGVGVPPMHFVAQRAEAADAVLAFRSQERALLQGEFALLCQKVLVMSDDGSIGTQGFAAQGVSAMLSQDNYAAVFACGPKIMLKTTFEAAQKAGVPCYVSLEERMGCGLGACLTCATPVWGADGEKTVKEVCKHGPVFRGEEVIWDA
jgi:dihydroorotate dehydrogenase electron transfer subunit